MRDLLKTMTPKDHAEEIASHRDLLLDSIQHSPLCSSSRCYCEFDKRRKSVERLCDLSMKGNDRTYGVHELLREIRSWLWLHHPTPKQWEQASRSFALAITSLLGDK